MPFSDSVSATLIILKLLFNVSLPLSIKLGEGHSITEPLLSIDFGFGPRLNDQNHI